MAEQSHQKVEFHEHNGPRVPIIRESKRRDAMQRVYDRNPQFAGRVVTMTCCPVCGVVGVIDVRDPMVREQPGIRISIRRTTEDGARELCQMCAVVMEHNPVLVKWVMNVIASHEFEGHKIDERGFVIGE